MEGRKKMTPNERWQKAKARYEKAKMDMRKIEKEMRAEEQKRKRKDMMQFCEYLQEQLHYNIFDDEHADYLLLLARIGALVQAKLEMDDNTMYEQQESILTFLDEYMAARYFTLVNGQYSNTYYAVDLSEAYPKYKKNMIRSLADRERLKYSSQEQLNAQTQNHSDHTNNQ